MNDNVTDLLFKSGINLDSKHISGCVQKLLTFAVAVITEQDINDVSCPTCGILPEIKYQDGNVKKASLVPENLTYTDLFEFKSALLEEVFFKNSNKICIMEDWQFK